MQITSLVRGAWRRAAPSRVRRRLSKLWKAPGQEVRGYARALRWRAMTGEQRRRWVREYNARTTESWLFVVGLHGSGTTLLKHVLERHPAIRSMPKEGQHHTDAVPQAVTYGYVRRYTERLDLFRLTEADAAMPALRAQYDWSFVYPPERGIKLEKTSTDIIRARWLQAHFRPARFLTVFRDPYAACASTRRRYPSIAVEAIAWQYKLAHDFLLNDLEHLERNLVVYYEDLCRDPDGELRRMSAFLELSPPLSSQTLPALMPTTKNLYEVELPLRDLNEQNRRAFTADEIVTIKRIAGDTIARVGYSPEPADGARPVRRVSADGRRGAA